MAFGIQKFINVKKKWKVYILRAAVKNIPGSYYRLNTFFRSRLPQVRQRHLGTLSVVNPLEASGLAVLRDATLKYASPPYLFLCASCLLLSDSSNRTVPTEEP